MIGAYRRDRAARRPDKDTDPMRTLIIAIAALITSCAAAPAAAPSPDLRPLTQIINVRIAQADDLIDIYVDAIAPTPGYSELTLRPVNYIQRPPDGMYDFTAVGKPPSGIVPM